MSSTRFCCLPCNPLHQAPASSASGPFFPGVNMSNYVIELFYDGACPLCMREIHMLRRRDNHKRIRFTDIAAPDFDATTVGRTWQSLMTKIHGRLPDGTILVGVDVFRRIYTALGFTKLVAFTRLPVVSQLLELGYRIFAKNRLRLTGRCVDGACQVNQAPAPKPAPPLRG